MKHESIVVVYDSCQAVAEEIADKLGAETVSVQSINSRQVENSRSFVLAVEYQDNGHLTPHWQYASQTLLCSCLSGKNFAVFVALGNSQGIRSEMDALCNGLRQSGGHVVGDQPYKSSPEWNADNWVCSISPNL